MEVRQQQGLILIVGLIGIIALLSSIVLNGALIIYSVYIGVLFLILSGGLGRFFNSKQQSIIEKFLLNFGGSFVLIIFLALFLFFFPFIGWPDFFFVIILVLWIVSGLIPIFPFSAQNKLSKELLQANKLPRSRPFFRNTNNSNYQTFDGYNNEN